MCSSAFERALSVGPPEVDGSQFYLSTQSNMHDQDQQRLQESTLLLPTIDDLLQRVGGNHTYQKRLLALFIAQWLIAAFILLGLNFLFVRSQLLCLQNQKEQACQARVCALNNSQWVKNLKNPNLSSISYSISPPLMCEYEAFISILQSLVYIGSLVGFFIFPFLADNYGRKISLKLSWAISTLGVVLVAVATDLSTVGLGLFLAGLGVNPAITLHFSFMSEQVSSNVRDTYAASLQIGFGVGEALIAVIFYYINNWRLNVCVFLLLPSLLLIIGNFYVLESPKFTLRRNRPRTLKYFNKMARINKFAQLEMSDVDAVCSDKQEITNRRSLYDLFRYPSLRTISLITGFVFFSVQLIYYGIIFILTDIGLNLYLNQIIVGVSETLSYIFSQLIISRISRKYYSIFGTVCSFILVLTLFFLNFFKPKQCDICVNVIIELVILFIMRFILCSFWSVFYVYIYELFPTKVRSIALGWTSTMGTVGSSLSPYMTQFSNPILYFSGAAGISSLMVLALPETKGKKLQDDIFEQKQLL